jgi:hypothetical protein
MVWVVEVVLAAAALLRQALLDQPQSRNGDSRWLWAGQVHGNRDIFWQCSVCRTGYLNRFPGRN